MTPVIIRVWKDTGDWIALFPTIPGNMDSETCMSYMHVGQHGACYPSDVVQATRIADPSEMVTTLRELENVGYDDLYLQSRMNRSMREKRIEALRK